MEAVIHGYFTQGIAQSTERTYRSAQRRFIRFCQAQSLSPLPLQETVLVAFAASVANEGLKHQTIKCYLSALRHMQITARLPDPFHAASFPYLEYVLKGIKKAQAKQAPAQRPRLPITPAILRLLSSHWSATENTFNQKMLWAAACMGFFGFLRAGEFTVPSGASFDPADCLTFADVAVNSHTAPSLVRVHLKQSKTDPFRQGVDVFLGRTGRDLCPVSAILSFMVARGSTPGPLFVFQSGAPLTRQLLVAKLRSALRSKGIDQSKYCGHSFRIGAATAAAAAGIEDSSIQMLGRWQSQAFLRYIQTPRDQLAAFSTRLIS